MTVSLQKSKILKHLLLQIQIHLEIIAIKTIKKILNLILKADKVTMTILKTKENQGIIRNLMTESAEMEINMMMIQIKSRVVNIKIKTVNNTVTMIVKEGKMITKGTTGIEIVVADIIIIINTTIKAIKIITIIKIITNQIIIKIKKIIIIQKIKKIMNKKMEIKIMEMSIKMI